MSKFDPELDMSLAKLDALADVWAEEVNLTAMIKNVVSPMRLNRNAPKEVREKFTARMEAQIDAIMRQAFIEGAVRVLPDDEEPRTYAEHFPQLRGKAVRPDLRDDARRSFARLLVEHLRKGNVQFHKRVSDRPVMLNTGMFPVHK
jgi:hypothetical protein